MAGLNIAVGHRGRHSARGLSLLEVVLSMTIIGALMPAIFALVGASAERSLIAQRKAQATWLAHDLLAEIGTRPCTASDPDLLTGITTALGDLLSPPGTGGARTAFATVFDYDGWDSFPPVDENGDPVPGFDGWYRAARVVPVNPRTHAVRPGTAAAARITVTVMGPGNTRTELVVVRTAAMDALRDTTSGTDTKDDTLESVLKGLGL